MGFQGYLTFVGTWFENQCFDGCVEKPWLVFIYLFILRRVLPRETFSSSSRHLKKVLSFCVCPLSPVNYNYNLYQPHSAGTTAFDQDPRQKKKIPHLSGLISALLLDNPYDSLGWLQPPLWLHLSAIPFPPSASRFQLQQASSPSLSLGRLILSNRTKAKIMRFWETLPVWQVWSFSCTEKKHRVESSWRTGHPQADFAVNQTYHSMPCTLLLLHWCIDSLFVNNCVITLFTYPPIVISCMHSN